MFGIFSKNYLVSVHYLETSKRVRATSNTLDATLKQIIDAARKAGFCVEKTGKVLEIFDGHLTVGMITISRM
jgi:hypothetical protein